MKKGERKTNMKKRLTILLALLFIAIFIFISDRYGDKFLPIKLDVEKIETVEISYDKPVIIEEPRPYQQLHEYVEYIESRKADFYGEPIKNIPVYRYEDMMFTTENGVRIIIGRDNGYYRIGGEIHSPAFRIFSVCPTDAIRESSAGESVYAVYDTDIGVRMYLFFSKEKNKYLVVDGFPIIMSKALEYGDFADVKIGDSSEKVQNIDPITSLHTRHWDDCPEDLINIYIEEDAGPTSVHLLKDGILKFEYNRIESGEYEIIDMEYNEDFILTGLDGETCYKISELDYPPKVKGRASIILSKENNADEIAEITRLYNESVQHHDHGVGTTHPIHVTITYNNGKEISFGCGVGNFITTAKAKRQYNYVNGELDEYINMLIEYKESAKRVKGNAKEERDVLYLNDEDCTDDMEPNPGTYMKSSGVSKFLSMDLSDDKYLAVKIDIYFDFEPFIQRNEYRYEGKTLSEWKNDPRALQYDNYLIEFKKLFSETDEYIKSKEDGTVDAMYRRYLESVADESNDIADIIATYDKQMEAEENYNQERQAYYAEKVRYIYISECGRLNDCGIYAQVIYNEETKGYCLKAEMNFEDIDSFPTGNYGYILSLYKSYDAIIG